jgi:uncharacterized membrane protein
MDWHPLIIHYPIALLPLSPLCDLAALSLRRREGHHLAYGLMVIGALSACAAVLSGNAAAEGYWHGSAAVEISAHEDLATWTLLLALGAALGRLPMQLRGAFSGRVLYVWLGIGLLIGGLVVYTGYLGGELVYVHGVGVGKNG